MASGLVCRANRPNTWLHRPACKREEKPCQPGAVHTWHFATHSAAIKSRPLWRRTGNERTHGLSHLDAFCLAALDLTVSNVVHPSTVHRQHLRRKPT
jgi:hypothetical protein